MNKEPLQFFLLSLSPDPKLLLYQQTLSFFNQMVESMNYTKSDGLKYDI
jgi:hypothetical protein